MEKRTPVARQESSRMIGTPNLTHKTFNPKFVQSTRNAGNGDEAETEGMANQ